MSVFSVLVYFKVKIHISSWLIIDTQYFPMFLNKKYLIFTVVKIKWLLNLSNKVVWQTHVLNFKKVTFSNTVINFTNTKPSSFKEVGTPSRNTIWPISNIHDHTNWQFYYLMTFKSLRLNQTTPEKPFRV